MNEKSIQKLTREKRIKKLNEIGQHGQGTLEKLKIKLRKFRLDPKTYERTKHSEEWILSKLSVCKQQRFYQVILVQATGQ